MIKKIIIIVTALFLMAAPCVQGDAAPPPTPAYGEYLDIELQIDTESADIDERFPFEMTVKNLTAGRIYLLYLYSGAVRIDYDRGDDAVLAVLDSYESVTIKGEMYISSYAEWYKKGNEFFADVQVQVDFIVGEFESFHFEVNEEIATLKIDNMYDGSDYIKLSWLDDRDTIYYNWFYEEDRDNNGKSEQYCDGSQMALVGVMYTGGKGVEYDSYEKITEEKDYFSSTEKTDEMTGKYVHTYRQMLEDGGNYYCVEVQREYKQEFLYAPQVKATVDRIEDENAEYEYVYRITIENNGDDAIENFMIWAPEDENDSPFPVNVYYDTLGGNQQWTMDFGYSKEENFIFLKLGYYIRGDIFFWNCDLQYPIEKHTELNPAVDVLKRSFREHYDNVKQGTNLLASINPVPEVAATDEPIVQEDKPTAQIEVIKNNTTNTSSFWLLMIVMVSAAVVFAAATIMNIKQRRKGSDDK